MIGKVFHGIAVLKGMNKSFYATVHMAGDINHARQVIRKFVLEGACVQLTPCEYIYTGGLEVGFTARFIQYPRFVQHEHTIYRNAEKLGALLCEELCQASFTIETSAGVYYFQNKNIDKK